MATKTTTPKAKTEKVAPINLECVSIRPIVEDLEKLFSSLNSQYFEGKLPKPVITVAPDMTKGAFGWCTTKKEWHDKDESYYEINICAEYLARPFDQICEVMLHEMCHLLNEKRTVSSTRQSSRKYICPCCGTIIRATKEVKVTCTDCDELFVEET